MNGFDVLRPVRIIRQRFAQSCNGLGESRFAYKGTPPYRIQQLAFEYQAIPVLNQKDQELEDGWLKVDNPAQERELPGLQVDYKITKTVFAKLTHTITSGQEPASVYQV